MEGVVYEHNVASCSQRLRRMKHALSAFLSEPGTAADVRGIALLVHIPVPSQVLKVTPVRRLPVRRPTPPKALSSASEQSRQQQKPQQQAGGQQLKRYTKLRAKLLEHRQARERAVRHCTAAAYARVHQASRDAVALGRWLRDQQSGRGTSSTSSKSSIRRSKGSHECEPRCYPRNPFLIVAAVLTPVTVADLSLYTAWQAPTRDALHCSPLREADLIVLNVGAGGSTDMAFRETKRHMKAAGTANDNDKGDRGGRKGTLRVGGPTTEPVLRYTSFFVDWQANGSPAVDLRAILLPHQSIILDVTWCVHAGMARYDGTALQDAGDALPGCVHDLDVFLTDFQRALKMPKESRAACWLSYSSSSTAVSGDGGSGSLLFRHFTTLLDGSSDPSTAAASGRSGKARRLRARRDFVHLHEEMAKLYRSLTCGPNTDAALLVGHGGTVADLLMPAMQVSLPRRALALTPDGSGALKRLHNVAPESASERLGKARAKTEHGNTSSPSSSSLLATRGLRDIFALVGFLCGADSADLYGGATRFTRTIAQRRAMARRLGRPRRVWDGVEADVHLERAATAVAPPRKRQRTSKHAATVPAPTQSPEAATRPAAAESVSPQAKRSPPVAKGPTASQQFLKTLVAAATKAHRVRQRQRKSKTRASRAVQSIAEGVQRAAKHGEVKTRKLAHPLAAAPSDAMTAEPTTTTARRGMISSPIEPLGWTEDV